MSARRSRRQLPAEKARAPQSISAGATNISGTWRQELLWYAALGLFAFALRAIYFLELTGELPFSVLIVDGLIYDLWAQDISQGNWLGTEIFYQAPLYPYFMAGIYKIFGHDPMMVRWVQASLGAISCVLLAAAGRAFVSRSVGLAAGFLLAIYPPALFFDSLIQKSSLDLFLMTLFLFTAGRFLQRPRSAWALAAGCALGAFILNRENGRLLYPIIVGWMLLYFQDVPRMTRTKWAGIFTLGVMLVLLPVGARNYYVGGEFLLSSSQLGPNLYIGNHRGATGLYVPLVAGRGHTIYEREDAIRLAEEATGQTLSPSEVSDYWRDQVFDYIRQEPLDWLRLMLKKIYLTFHSVELVDSEGIEVYAAHSWLLNGLSWFSFGLLVPLAMLGGWITRDQWRRLAVLYASVLMLAASVAIFFVFARYRYPMVPILMIFGGATVCTTIGWLRRRGEPRPTARWIIPATMAIVLAIVFNWPQPQYRDDAIAYANYGRELLEARNFPRAQEALQRSVTLQPHYPGARYNLGIALMSQGQVNAAEQQFRTVLRLDPEYGRAYWFLGQIERDRGNIPSAIEQFQTAVRLAPEQSLIHVDLALLLLQTDNAPAALEHLNTAVALAPDQLHAVNNLAWVLATSSDARVRNGQRAIQIAQPLRELDDPNVLDTVAAAYAEAGQWDEALTTIAHAIQLAQQSDDAELVATLTSRQTQYEQKRPHRDTP